MANDLELKLLGDIGEIGADALHDALGATLELLRDAARAVDAPPRRWTVDNLSVSCAAVALGHPAPAPIMAIVAVGLDTLRREATIPAGWTPHMVGRVRRLGRVAGTDGTQGVSLGTSPDQLWVFDALMTDHATRALEGAEITIGTVSGVVDKWTQRGRREVGMTLDDGGTLTATFTADLSERVKQDALDRRIEAWGELERNNAGQPIRLRIADFDFAGPHPVTRPIREMWGLFLTGGPDDLTLDEWLEKRNGD